MRSLSPRSASSFILGTALLGGSTALAQREAPSNQPPWVMLPAVAGSSSAAPAGSSSLAPTDASPATSAPPALPSPTTAPPAPAPPPTYYPPPAYGAQPYYIPPPRYYYEPPPPAYLAPYRRPGFHYHEGFYFRFGVGITAMTVRAKLPYGQSQGGIVTNARTSDTLSGAALALDAAIGGAVAPGFILAADLGGLGTDSVDSTGAAPPYGIPTTMSYSRLGILADWYPNPRRGFHVQGGVSFAELTLGYDDGSADGLVGIGGNVGTGYEWWVGSDLGIGALVRLDFASATRSTQAGSEPASLFAPSVLFTMTFN